MRICVYVGANFGGSADYLSAATELGARLARSQHVLVYGGAAKGLMGALADSALNRGGQVVGVIPRVLVDAEIAHKRLSELIVVETLHERKLQMATRADGFVVLPGGFGTLEELFEIITWAQLGIHRKPIVLINICGFFDPFLALVDSLVANKFVRIEHRNLFSVVTTVEDALDAVSAFVQPPVVPKWI